MFSQIFQGKRRRTIAEAKAGDKMDMSDLIALLDNVVELTDYCHHDPTQTEYKVLKSFKIVAEE